MPPSLSSEQLWRAACPALCPVQSLSRTACSQGAVLSSKAVHLPSPPSSRSFLRPSRRCHVYLRASNQVRGVDKVEVCPRFESLPH